MPVVGRITAKFDADTKSLDASLAGIESGVNQTTVAVTAGFSKMEGSLAKSTKSIEKASDAIVLKDKLQAGVALFGQIAGAIDGVRQEFNKAGGEADDLRDRLSATFGELADEKAKFAEDQLKLGFDADSTANALITFKKFGVEGSDAFKRLQDAARFTNTDIASLADSFGRFEKFADAKSLKALQKELGISNEELEKFGAKLDANGKPLLDTEARVKAAAQALRDYQAANFAGAADRQADAATRLSGEMEALKREIGLNVTQLKEGFSPALLGVVQGLRGMSAGTKAAIGLGVEFVGQAASMAATALSLGSQLVIMSGNAKLASIGLAACNSATAAFTATLEVALGPLGLAALAVTGLALAVAQYNDDLAEAADNEVILSAAQEHNLVVYEKNKDLIGKNADELRKMGKTAKDVGELVKGLQAQQEKARAANDGAGDKEAEARYNAQAIAANKVRSELEKIEEAEAKRKKPAAASVSDLSEKERQKLAKQKEAEEKRQAAVEEKARKEALDKQLDIVKQGAASGEITKQQQIEGLRDVLATANVTASERRTIEIQIATLQGQLRKEQTAEEKRENQKRTAEAKAEAAKRGREEAKAAADAKRAAAKESSTEKVDKAQIERLASDKANAEKSAIDKQIQGLDEGKDLATIERLLKQKLAITEAEINAEKEATIKATKNEDVKAAATEAAEAKIKAARAETTTALTQATERQKAALQSLQDKSKATANSLIQDQQAVAASADPRVGLNEGLGISLSSLSLGNVSFGDLKKPGQKASSFQTPALTQLPGTPNPFIDPNTQAKAQGQAVATALKETPLAITLTTNVNGQSKSTTFSGTAEKLSSSLNTFNADFTLGIPS